MEDIKVKKQEPVKIRYVKDLTGKGGTAFVKKGKVSTVHAVQAEKLVAHGKAEYVDGKPEPAKAKGGKV